MHHRGNRGGAINRGRGGYRGGRVGVDEGGYRGSKIPLVPVAYGEGAVFPFTVEPNTKAYRSDVVILFYTKDRSGKEFIVNLTNKKRDSRIRAVCFHAVSIVYRNTQHFETPDLKYVYDNQSTMYTSVFLSGLDYEINKNVLPLNVQGVLTGKGSLKVMIHPNEEFSEVNISDFEQYKTRRLLLFEDQRVRQVLEMILSQSAVTSGKFNFVGDGQLFRIEADPVERGVCTRSGVHKGVRFVDVDGDIYPALVVDIKRSPFYESGNLLLMVQKFMHTSNENKNWKDAETFFKGVKVFPIYEPHRMLKFSSFTQKKVNEITIELTEKNANGEDITTTVTMEHYFRTKKQISLHHTDTFAMVSANGLGYFPLELMQILPNQHVNLEQVSDSIRALVHKRNAVVASERYNAIIDEVDHLDVQGEIASAFGIKYLAISGRNITLIKFYRPPKPTILCGGDSHVIPDENGRFNLGGATYLRPAKIGRWAVLYHIPTPSNEIVINFLNAFQQEATRRGITFLEQPKLFRFNPAQDYNDWDSLFKMLQSKNVKFVLLIDPKSSKALHSHGFLKMFECKYKILTQQVDYNTTLNVIQKHQHVTLSNILYKTNVKNGGINYKPLFDNAGQNLDVNSGKVLVIAYDVSHPGGVNPGLVEPQKESSNLKNREDETPSVVGLVANVIKDPAAFVGNYFYQQPRCEAVNAGELRAYTTRLLTQMRKNRPNMLLPSTVVILRDGVSEGQFRMVLEDELRTIKSGFYDFNKDYKPKFVVALATKRHHKRFFENNKQSKANPAAGSFITERVVRPDCVEFFMGCHKAIKGTAKFVQVSVILNEPKVSNDEIKDFLHSLSYGHQIVTSPVSLPTPVYQADGLATRGREVFNTYRKFANSEIPRHSNGSINYVDLSTLLNYSSSDLLNTRFNA